jgi:hypothetical protein
MSVELAAIELAKAVAAGEQGRRSSLDQDRHYWFNLYAKCLAVVQPPPAVPPPAVASCR